MLKAEKNVSRPINLVTAEQDALYLEAIRQKDTGKLRRMVNAAAEEAGLGGVGQHATKTHFREFDAEKAQGGNRGWGFYFSDVFFPGSYGEINYSARIPSDEVLVNWNKMFRDQPETAQRVLTEMMAELNPETPNFEEYTGESFYRTFICEFDSQRAASEALDRAGIKGIKYGEWRPERLERGDRDGRVIFSSQNIKPADLILRDRGQEIIPLSKRFSGTYTSQA
jgi:hypothetical protein